MFLTTGEVALGAPAIATGGTLAGAWAQARRDDKRWERERQQERERWQRGSAQREAERGQGERLRILAIRHEDATRYADRRLALHTRFLEAVRELQHGLEQISISLLVASDRWPASSSLIEPMKGIRTAAAEIRLIASDETVSRTGAVEQACFRARTEASSFPTLRHDYDREAHVRRFRQAKDQIGPAVSSYVDAARAELGTVFGRLEELTDGKDGGTDDAA